MQSVDIRQTNKMTNNLFSRRSFIQYAVAGATTANLLGSCFKQKSTPQSQELNLPPLSPQANGYNISREFCKN